MRLLRIIASGREYLDAFFAGRPGLAHQAYAAQRAALTYDHLAWGDGLSDPLAQLGYEVEQLESNAGPLLRAWERENLSAPGTRTEGEIVVEQVRRFRPVILMYDSPDQALLVAIRSSCPDLRVCVGWTGSALGFVEIWRHLDVVLSCAPESVVQLRSRGFHAEHVNHAFDARVLARLGPYVKDITLSFVGSIVRRASFHLEREALLLRLLKKVPMQIYCPNRIASSGDYVKAGAAGSLFMLQAGLRGLGVQSWCERRSPFLAKALQFASPPRLPVNRTLAKAAKSAVYGLEYYQVIARSLVSLNIHADSSPRFASNIRLFEGAGIGSCLLTDWKENLGDLFELDREVVAYRNADECVEKARWLIDHPQECAEIARRGQERTLREHNFQRRAAEIDRVVRAYL